MFYWHDYNFILINIFLQCHCPGHSHDPFTHGESTRTLQRRYLGHRKAPLSSKGWCSDILFGRTCCVDDTRTTCKDYCCSYLFLSVVLIFVLFLFDLCIWVLHFFISPFDRPGQASTREPRPAFSTANKENTYLSTWNPTTNSTAGFLQKLNRPAFPPFNNRCANEASTRRAGRPNRRCPTWRATVSCLIRWGRSASGQYCRTTGLQHCERCKNVWRNVKCKGIGGKRRTSLDQESVILRFCALVTWRGSWRWVLNLFYETDVDTSARLIHLEVLIHIIHAWITLGLVHIFKQILFLLFF